MEDCAAAATSSTHEALFHPQHQQSTRNLTGAFCKEIALGTLAHEHSPPLYHRGSFDWIGNGPVIVSPTNQTLFEEIGIFGWHASRINDRDDDCDNGLIKPPFPSMLVSGSQSTVSTVDVWKAGILESFDSSSAMLDWQLFASTTASSVLIEESLQDYVSKTIPSRSVLILMQRRPISLSTVLQDHKITSKSLHSYLLCPHKSMIIANFFDLRDAMDLVVRMTDSRQIRSLFICYTCFDNLILMGWTEVSMSKDPYDKRENWGILSVEIHGDFLMEPVEVLVNEAKDMLESFGRIAAFSEQTWMERLGTRVKFFVEYMDLRTASRAYEAITSNDDLEMNLAYCRLPIGERESMFFTTIISDLSIPSNNESVKPVLPSPAPSQQASPKNNHTRTSYEIDVDSVIQDGRTTCMIRNIPNKYTQQMLIDLINETHADTYDFVYLRMDFKNKCNVGYAFINFVHPRHIGTFHRRLVGKRWPRFNSDKICGLSYARIQGQKALVEKFRHSRVMLEPPSYRPKMFFADGAMKGMEQAFPA